MNHKILKRYRMTVLLAIALTILPMIASLVFTNIRNYIVLIGFNILMYIAMSSAWNIIGGFGRQISWAHASFFAVGAYSSMILLLDRGISPWFGMIVGAAIAACLALIMGIASFKFQGVFFSLASIACGQIVYRLLLYFSNLTGGANGLVMRKIEKDSFLLMQFMNGDVYYYIMLILALLIIILCIWIERSRLGYYLKALREDEIAAESIGIKPYMVKLIAFIISAMLMAIIGTVFALKYKYIDPDSVASHDLAIRIGMTALIGGIGTIEGPIIGAIIGVPLLELTNAFFGNILNGGLSQTLYGAILIAMVLFLPDGVISIRERMKVSKMVKGGEHVEKYLGDKES